MIKNLDKFGQLRHLPEKRPKKYNTDEIQIEQFLLSGNFAFESKTIE
jgi:hypothetical protein